MNPATPHHDTPDPLRVLAHTFEIGQAKLKLRTDLRFTLHQDAASPWYLVEDESRGNYFRVGVVEYAFLSLLNGKRTLDQAMATLASMPCCDDLPQHRSTALTRWVIDSGLAETTASISTQRVEKQQGKQAAQQRMQALNPIAFRIPLFNPESLLKRIYAFVRPICGWPIALVWLLVCSYGAITMAMFWDTFWQRQVFAMSGLDFAWLAVAWFVLKIFHEGAHGLVCKHYGGRVPQFGVLMLLMIPLPFIDVSSSWRFTNKSARILTAAGGMMAEAFLASIAMVVWTWCSPGPMQFHLGNFILAASLHTLLFNANPLMKFDGYYMLIDWIEIPNLYTNGRAFVRSFFGWIFFGIEFDSQIESTRRQTAIVKAYGVASMIWMVMICLTLGIAASSMFNGFGLLIALAAVVLWVGLPLWRLVSFLADPDRSDSSNRRQFAMVTSGMVMVTALVLMFCPAPSGIVAPLVIDYDDANVVRLRSSGFVDQIFVTDGQQVRAGERLAKLNNPQLLADVKRLESDLAAAELRAEVFRSDGDIAAWKLENDSVLGLEKQLNELRLQQQHLEILAPADGVVISGDLAQFQDAWLTPGERFVSIGDPERMTATAMVTQADAVWLRSMTAANEEYSRLGNSTIRLWGRALSPLDGEILEIAPRATSYLPHFSFASSSGGPLSVVNREQVESKSKEGDSSMQKKSANTLASRMETLDRLQGDGQSDSQSKLVGQFVPVRLAVTTNAVNQPLAGQTGTMITRRRQTTLGSYLADRCQRWFANNIRLTHGL